MGGVENYTRFQQLAVKEFILKEDKYGHKYEIEEEKSKSWSTSIDQRRSKLNYIPNKKYSHNYQ